MNELVSDEYKFMLLGHLAVPTLLKHYFDLEPIPLYASSLLPDVVDKALRETKVFTSSRTISHSLLGFGLSSTAVYLTLGKKQGHSWVIGYFGHLLCDMGGKLPLLFPFKKYGAASCHTSMSIWQKVKRGFRKTGPVEITLILWSFLVVARSEPPT